MTDNTEQIKSILVDRIFLNHENPRHEPYQSQAEVIEYLCKEENVIELAKDIAKHGLSPIDIFALIPQDDGKGKLENYYVAEGNRRICALKLLNDPELAPAKRRKDVEKIAENSDTISEVQAIIFKDKESVNLWLERTHAGVQGGIGRRSWTSDQKTRHFGNTKNILAQRILDYGVDNNFLSNAERRNKLTTVQRYVSNPLLRDALGVDNSNIEDISRNRPKEIFDLLVKQFLDDLLSGKVNSRSKSKNVVDYSRELNSTEGVTPERIAPEPLLNRSDTPSSETSEKKSPKNPKNPTRLRYEEEINNKLKKFSNFKLEKIYYSICSINLETHTCLISVGVWSFIESLTAKANRKSGTDFYSFLSKSKLKELKLDSDAKAIREAVKRISEFGNTTKHHESAANFNGLQLYNDMETIKELILALCDEIIRKNISK